jgi:cytochrome c
LLIFLLLCSLDAPSSVHAQEEPSPELIARGEELFMQKGGPLGTKFACILCHKGEKAIEKVKVMKLGDKLPEAINGQIVKQAKGKPLPMDGEELKALAAYIRHKHSI